MSFAKDPLLRQLSMLQMIPKSPGRIATTSLTERLLEQGFEASERTIQRDLQKLSSIFPIILDDSSKPYRWCLDPSCSKSFPTVDTSTSLAFALAEPFLERLLPNTALSLIRRETNKAKQHLGALERNELSKWQDKVRMIPNGLQFIHPKVEECVWQNLSDALLHEKQVAVNYFSRKRTEARELVLSPLGIVNKSTCSYLVAIADGYETPTIYALHRFNGVELLSSSVKQPADFCLDSYINSGALGWGESDSQRVNLIAKISEDLAFMLREAPLDTNQKLTELKQGYRLEVSVPNNKETLWWLFSLNSQIIVLQPKTWVKQICDSLEEQLKNYSKASLLGDSTIGAIDV